MQGDKLYSLLADGEPSELVPVSPTEFVFRSNGLYLLRFNSDSAGRIDSVEQYYRSRFIGRSMGVEVVPVA